MVLWYIPVTPFKEFPLKPNELSAFASKFISIPPNIALPSPYAVLFAPPAIVVYQLLVLFTIPPPIADQEPDALFLSPPTTTAKSAVAESFWPPPTNALLPETKLESPPTITDKESVI